ncbi:MAG: hypothetical protein HKN47_12460 [Pirellulaceae bacterium]|nr:hypothetical protein [Pirellulaceae bacterium]
MAITQRTAILTITIAAILVIPAAAQEKKPPKITYDEHVKPIFQQKCFSCHNPDKKSADLDLTTYTNLMQGGASGTVIEAGDASASYLYELVTHESEPVMPPESPKIPDPMIETLRKWIDGGVLENSGSTAKASNKKKYDLALAAPSTERPAVIPMPARLNLQPVVYTPTRTAIDALATSPWAPLAAVGSQKQVLLYNTQTLDLVGVLPFPEGTPRVLKFSRNGGLLLAGGGVGGASGRVVVWNIRNGERIIEIGSELDEVLAADISSDQTLIALGGPNRVVRIYSTDSGQLLHEIRKHTDWVTTMEFSPDSVLLATGDRNGGLFVWEGWTGREYLTLNGHTGSVSNVSWRSDSNILASCSEDASIRLWEMENGNNIKNWGAHGGGALGVEFTRDGRLFSCGRDKTPKLWDQNGAQQRAFEAFGDLALQATYCDETNRAISGDFNGEIRVYNAADGARIGELVVNAPKLEDRLAQATQLLTSKQTEHKPIADAYNAAKAAFDKIKNDHIAALQLATDSKNKLDQANVAFNAAKEVLAKLTAEHAAAKQQADAMAKGMPELTEAASKAVAAAAQIPDNTALAAAAKTIQDAASEKAATLAAMTKAAADKAAAMQTAQQDMAAKQKLAAEMATTYNDAAAKEKALLPTVKPAEDKANGEKAKFDKVTAELTHAQQLVSRWQGEIAFTKTYTDLTNQRSAARTALDALQDAHAEVQSVFDTAAAELTAATTALADAEKSIASYDQNYKATLANVETAKQELTVATNAKTAANANVNKMTQLVTKLNETVAKAAEAVEIAKDDPAVIASLSALKGLVAEKTKQLDAAKVDLTNKTKVETDATAKAAAIEKAAADLLAQKQAIEAKIPALTAAIPPLQQKSDLAKQAVESSAKTVAQSQQKVDAITKQIAIAQGLETAA